METFQNNVNDKLINVSGGIKYITTSDDCAFPLNINSGLPYTDIISCTNDKLNILPNVIITSDSEWNPIILDCNSDDGDAENDDWYDAIYDTSSKQMAHYLITLKYISIDIAYMVLALKIMIFTMASSRITPYSMTSMNMTRITHIKMMM